MATDIERDEDEEEDDLDGIDLDALELGDIDLGDEPAAKKPWVSVVVLLLAGALVLWIPSTDWFRLLGQDGGHFFVLAAVGIVIGILLGRALWRLAAASYVATSQRKTGGARLPSRVSRGALLALVLLGAGVILYVSSDPSLQQGQGSQLAWFAAALGAVVVGVIFGRWLLLQATASPSAPRVPIKLPPWFKWVTLSLLVGTALFVLVGKVAGVAGDQSSLEFILAAAGFVAGVGGAIWLARRFDEWEKKHAAKTEGKHER